MNLLSTTDQCPKCDGMGFVHIEGTTSARECECRLLLMTARCYEKANIPRGYLHANFENFNPIKKMPDHKKAMEELYKFVDNWPRHKAYGDCVSILGSTRVGKSHMAIATGREIIDRYQKSIEDDIVLFINLTTWEEAWSKFWTRWPVSMPAEKKYNDSEWNETNAWLYRMAKRMRTVELLILDDLSVFSPNPKSLGRLYELVEHRVSENKPIIVTDNVKWDVMVMKHGDEMQRIVDRLRERSIDHSFVFEEVKTKKKARKR